MTFWDFVNIRPALGMFLGGVTMIASCFIATLITNVLGVYILERTKIKALEVWKLRENQKDQLLSATLPEVSQHSDH